MSRRTLRDELQELQDAVDQLRVELGRSWRRLLCRLEGHRLTTQQYGRTVTCVRCGWRW